ncbi:hypothetical protein KKH39_02435 [Patescibacteria group bacterium]|nr:hypothetical protein [Patescibacteria group bacterium]
MKSDFHFHFYSRIAIMAVFAFALVFMQRSVETTALESAYDINGWAWSEAAGWLSLDCLNDTDGDGQPNDQCVAGGNPYDWGLDIVNINNDSHVQGCAYAGTSLSNGADPLGWVCFSRLGGNEALIDGVPTSSDPALPNALDPSSYASILTQEPLGNQAWKLGFPIANEIGDSSDDIDYPSSSNPLEGCFNCYEEYLYECAVTGQACDPLIGCPPAAGVPQACVVSGINQNCDNCMEYFYYLGRCDTTDSIQCRNDDECPTGESCQPISTCSMAVDTECVSDTPDCGDLTEICNAGICSNNQYIGCTDDSDCYSFCVEREIGSLKKVVGGYTCSSCTIENYANVCGTNAYQGNINRCDSCAAVYYTPGVVLDHQHYALDPSTEAKMCGWAWNGWTDGINNYGLGWFQFGPRVVTSTRPYISSEGGDIYSKGNIKARYTPPFGKYNASYLIESGGTITNFISSSTLSVFYQGELPYRPAINFFSWSDTNSKYTNVLGSLDYTGIITGVGSIPYNKFGSLIIDIDGSTPANFINYFNSALNGSVLYLGNSNSFTLPVGSDLVVQPGLVNANGSGVVVVDGDLTINRNVVYGTGTYANLKQIPSLVWIVRGDIYISSQVDKLAGTFIVLGDSDRAADCSALDTGCGQFVTCQEKDASCRDYSLSIKGNVLARYFDLSRTFIDAGTKEPAEKFINDGRLQVNPPPGFVDFSKLIPRFSENPD